jgi:PhoH-like ATPase
MQPIYDNLDFLFRGCSDSKNVLDDFLRRGTIEMETLTHIRGRSIPNQFILCDEAAVNKNIYRSQRNSSLTQF